MKKIITVVLASIALISLLAYAATNHFWFGKTMSIDQAEAHWGHSKFSTDEFKNGDVKLRAQMAASLVREKKDWIGKPVKMVREKLGSHDGFYFTDWIPAYLIQIAKKKSEESWQVVFLPDRDYLIKDIIIHRNCCE